MQIILRMVVLNAKR